MIVPHAEYGEEVGAVTLELGSKLAGGLMPRQIGLHLLNTTCKNDNDTYSRILPHRDNLDHHVVDFCVFLEEVLTESMESGNHFANHC